MYAVIALAALLVSPDYDALIDNLAGDPKTARHAHDTLNDAGTEAFPALLKRIDDKTVIDTGVFHGATVHKPTIGRVSFEIIQYQIESAWPKGFRAHYALNEQNVAAWLARHEGLSITQLRIRALVDSMDSLSRVIETDGVTDFRLKNLSFFRDRLGKVLEDAKQRQ
jgi:hypothetical protein